MAFDAGDTPSQWLDVGTAPDGVFAMSWRPQLYMRPQIGEDNLYVTSQIDWVGDWDIAVPDALEYRLIWDEAIPDMGIHVHGELDVPAERATISVTGPDGSQASRKVRVRLATATSFDRPFLVDSVEWTELARVPDGPRPEQHEDRITIAATGDFRSIDLYTYAPKQAQLTFGGNRTYEIAPSSATMATFPITLDVTNDEGWLRVTPSTSNGPPVLVPEDAVFTARIVRGQFGPDLEPDTPTIPIATLSGTFSLPEPSPAELGMTYVVLEARVDDRIVAFQTYPVP